MTSYFREAFETFNAQHSTPNIQWKNVGRIQIRKTVKNIEHSTFNAHFEAETPNLHSRAEAINQPPDSHRHH